jgi:hypothetical protein
MFHCLLHKAPIGRHMYREACDVHIYLFFKDHILLKNSYDDHKFIIFLILLHLRRQIIDILHSKPETKNVTKKYTTLFVTCQIFKVESKACEK